MLWGDGGLGNDEEGRGEQIREWEELRDGGRLGGGPPYMTTTEGDKKYPKSEDYCYRLYRRGVGYKRGPGKMYERRFQQCCCFDAPSCLVCQSAYLFASADLSYIIFQALVINQRNC